MSFEYKLAQVTENYGVGRTREVLSDAVKEKKFNIERDFSLRRLAEAFLGRDRLAEKLSAHKVYEAGVEATSVSNFLSIGGQLLVSYIHDQYTYAPVKMANMVRTVGVTNNNLGSERIPWISNNLEFATIVNEGELIPSDTIQPNYIDLPPLQKYARLIHLTAELVLGDKTGQVLQAGANLAKNAAIVKELNILRTLCGFGETYKFNGTSYNPWQAFNATTPTFLNNGLTSFSFSDWTSVQKMEQVIVQQKDPNTGVYLNLLPPKRQILCTPQALYSVSNVLKSVMVRSGPFATSGTGSPEPSPVGTYSNNPLGSDNYEVIDSVYWQQILTDAANTAPQTYSQSANSFIFGDIANSLMVRQIRPATVEQLAPGNNILQFSQDILASFRFLEHYSVGWYEPRMVVKTSATASL